MRKSLKIKLGAVGTTLALAGALAVVASGTTGAYFSETRTGAISGTLGTVHVQTEGGAAINNPTFSWDNMLPGEFKEATVTFKNTGTVPQDVYLKFPNATALSGLNSLGTFGEAHIIVNGIEKFASQNLTDKYPCGTPGLSGVATLCPVPSTQLLATDVAPGANGTMTFKFRYASKLAHTTRDSSDTSGGGIFNAYPAWDGQVTTISADGKGVGLPWQFVATQVGQQP